MRALPVLLLISFACAAQADDFQPTFQATSNSVVQRSDCMKTNDPGLVIFTCKNDKSLWYFTKSGNAAYPGIVKRSFMRDADGAISIHDSGRFYGTDDRQPAFKAWLDSIVAFDAKANERLAREHAQR